MAEYSLTFVNGWSYNGYGGYWDLAKFKNNNPYAVKITGIKLYLGTGNGRFHPSPASGGGDDMYGQGNSIYNWLQILDSDRNNSYLATSPKDENYGKVITKQVASEYEGWGNYYIPIISGCGLYSYTTFTTTWQDSVSPEIPAGHTILIRITGGGFSSIGRGVLCVNNAQGYITVEPVNPNVTLTLNYNYSGAPSSKVLTVPINNNTSLGANPTRTGYSFDGWYTTSTGGSRVNSPYKVTKNTTLYAHWNINSYIISYDANGGENAPSSQSANYASQITLTLDTPTYIGRIFSSWNTEDDGTGVSYAPGNTITMPATNILLYAQWLQAPPIWVYSTTDNKWHNAADSSDTQNYRPIYRYDEANSQWENNQNINIYNKPNDETPGIWKEVTSNGGQ